MTRKELKAMVKECVYEVITEEFTKGLVKEIGDRVSNTIKSKMVNEERYSLSDVMDEEDERRGLPTAREMANPKADVRKILSKKVNNPAVRGLMEQVLESGGLEDSMTPAAMQERSILDELPEDLPFLKNSRNRYLAGMTDVDPDEEPEEKPVVRETRQTQRRQVFNPELDQPVQVGEPRKQPQQTQPTTAQIIQERVRQAQEQARQEPAPQEDGDVPEPVFRGKVKDFRQMSLLDDEAFVPQPNLK